MAEAADGVSQPPDRAGRLVRMAQSWMGPIPSPEALARYEKTLPGAADRVVTMAERQLAHRQQAETALVRNDARARMAGLIAGLVAVLAALALAGVLAALGQPVWAFAIALVEITALAGVFVYGTQNRNKERRTRLEEMLTPTVNVSEPSAEQPSESQLPRE